MRIIKGIVPESPATLVGAIEVALRQAGDFPAEMRAQVVTEHVMIKLAQIVGRYTLSRDQAVSNAAKQLWADLERSAGR